MEIIFTSLAAGTFVYIGCSEVIIKEFAVIEHRVWKMVAYLSGALIITSLFFIEKALGT